MELAGEVSELGFVARHRPHGSQVTVDRLCAGHGIKPNITYETDSTATMRGMVERGMAAAIFSLNTSWSYLVESGQLIALPFASPLMNWKLHLARTDRGASAVAIDRVAEIVAQELRILVDSGCWPNARPIAADSI